MPVYQFTATDQNGDPQQGTFEAPNEEQAYAQLAQYGLTVSKVLPIRSPRLLPALPPLRLWNPKRRNPLKNRKRR